VNAVVAVVSRWHEAHNCAMLRDDVKRRSEEECAE
jgi:hypothetical protein